MKKRLNNRGFASWELLLVFVVLAAIAFAGYHSYTARKTGQTATTANSAASTTPVAQPVSVPPAPTITSTAGLDQSLAVLNETNPSSSNVSDTNQLSSQSNF